MSKEFNWVNSLTDSVDWEVAKLAKQKEEIQLMAPAIQMIQQAFSEASFGRYWLSGIEVTLPMNQKIINEWKEFVLLQFPEWVSSYENVLIWDDIQKAGRFIIYETPAKIQMHLSFRSTVKGATCVLNKIGVKEIAVYEAVCSQEAADELNMSLTKGGETNETKSQRARYGRICIDPCVSRCRRYRRSNYIRAAGWPGIFNHQRKSVIQKRQTLRY